MAKRFNHPNILNLIGVSYIKGEGIPLMVLPFMHNGDVKSFVKSKRGNALEVTEYPEVCMYVATVTSYLFLHKYTYLYIVMYVQYTQLNGYCCMSVYSYVYLCCLDHRDLTVTFLKKCVWTSLKEWNIYHHFVAFIVTLLQGIACEYILTITLHFIPEPKGWMRI